LLANGFCTFENVVEDPMLDELRRVTDRLLAEADQQELQRYRYQGSNISMQWPDPIFADLVSYGPSLLAMAELGFDQPKFWSGYILSKAPRAPALYWHQDWPYWGEPVSADDEPPQVFCMYYLTDTSPTNGCLRVIPGTHRRRIDLHDRLPEAHTDDSYYAEADSPLFEEHSDAVDVTVKAGDLVIGDSRVLHAAHANQTDERRTCLTLWYLPRLDVLGEAIWAANTKGRSLELPPTLTDAQRRALEPVMLPPYEGDAEPAPWNRLPGQYLST
jgi:hypothetical protein